MGVLKGKTKKRKKGRPTWMENHSKSQLHQIYRDERAKQKKKKKKKKKRKKEKEKSVKRIIRGALSIESLHLPEVGFGKEKHPHQRLWEIVG